MTQSTKPTIKYILAWKEEFHNFFLDETNNIYFSYKTVHGVECKRHEAYPNNNFCMKNIKSCDKTK